MLDLVEPRQGGRRVAREQRERVHVALQVAREEPRVLALYRHRPVHDHKRNPEEVEVLLRDRLLEIADDGGQLERERLGDHSEDGDSDLDRAADRLVLDSVVALVLDEAAELANLLYR